MKKIILALICALSLTLGACEKREAKKESEVTPPQATGIFSDKVPQKVVDLATGPLADFGKDKTVLKAVADQNARGQTKAQIEAMDKEWQAAKKEGKTEPFMKALMENPCATQLKKLMTEHPFITEIFVTDNQGANVCQTGLTGDYWQGDEAKFKEVFKKGILVSHPEVEDGMNITQVSVPVLMKVRHIGTMTIGVNIDKVPEPEAAETVKSEGTEKPEAVPAAAEQAVVAKEETKEAAPEPQAIEPGKEEEKEVKEKEPLPTPVEITEKVEEAREEEKVAEEKAAPEQQEETAEKEKAVEEEAQTEAVVQEKSEEAPQTAQEEAEKVTQPVEKTQEQVEEAQEQAEEATQQVEEAQEQAEEVKQEVVQVADQVKVVSEEAQKVSEENQQIIVKARKAMDEVVKARAQLRDAAHQLQKAAALVNQKLAEIELLTEDQETTEE